MRRLSKDHTAYHTAYWQTYELFDAVAPSKLALIGAICLEWNFIEDIVDDAVGWAAYIELDMRDDVVSRISGLDGKFEIIKKGARLVPLFNEEQCNLIAATIGSIAEHKKYRDAVIHARLFNPDSDIAGTTKRKGKSYEVLISEDALRALYDRLRILSDEIIAVWRLLEGFNFVALDFESGDYDLDKLLASPELRDGFAQLQQHQNRRLSLPPLPRFPDQDTTPPEKGVLQSPPD